MNSVCASCHNFFSFFFLSLFFEPVCGTKFAREGGEEEREKRRGRELWGESMTGTRKKKSKRILQAANDDSIFAFPPLLI